jgi:hypothetical protein
MIQGAPLMRVAAKPLEEVAMNRLSLAICASFFVLTMSSVGIAATDDLLNGVPTPPDSKSLGAQAIASGGQQARYSTSANPGAVIASYKQALTDAGWTVTGGGGGGSSYGGGAGLQATNGPKYLSVNAGGPADMTFVNVCVWPSKPSHDNCGDND